MDSVLDIQIGGSHYKNCGYQPILFAEKTHMHPSCFSILKYVLRHKDKNGKEDLEKALHYCAILKECSGRFYDLERSSAANEFFKFILNNKHLDRNQIISVLSIQNKDIYALEDSIASEIREYYDTNFGLDNKKE